LEETLRRYSIGVSLQRQRPVPEVGQHSRRDASVVLDQLSLGDAVIGEQHLLGPGNLDLAAIHSDHAL
jgi:hypothetical protein